SDRPVLAGRRRRGKTSPEPPRHKGPLRAGTSGGHTTEGEGVSYRCQWSVAMTDPFVRRHIGPSAEEQRRMLDTVGYGSLEELLDAAIPEAIRWSAPLDLPPAGTEAEVLAELRALAAQNRPAVSMIGLGYAGTHTPPVIRRNVLENPAWYTAYTPYQ